jgi:hypothetical protein
MTTEDLDPCQYLPTRTEEAIVDLGTLTAAIARNDYEWIHSYDGSLALDRVAGSMSAARRKLVAATSFLADTLGWTISPKSFEAVPEARP